MLYIYCTRPIRDLLECSLEPMFSPIRGFPDMAKRIFGGNSIAVRCCVRDERIAGMNNDLGHFFRPTGIDDFPCDTVIRTLGDSAAAGPSKENIRAIGSKGQRAEPARP